MRAELQPTSSSEREAQVVTLHVSDNLTADLIAPAEQNAESADDGPLSLIDGVGIVWARENYFDIDDGLKSIEFAVAQRAATFAKSARLPQLREAAARVAGVAKAEWENDASFCSLGIVVVDGFDPADVLLEVGEELRARFGPPTWYNVHLA